jgi:hypothetical protein
MLQVQQIFEVPYVEKYRPVTLEDVVGKYYLCFIFEREHTCNRSTKVDSLVWQHAQFNSCRKLI